MIGQEFYPVDNSYSQDLRNGNYPDINRGAALAGNYKIPAVRVKILSEPFFLSLENSIGGTSVQEMVIVEYKKKKFLVLNMFRS